MIYIKLLILRIALILGVVSIGFISISTLHNSKIYHYQTIFGLIIVMIIGIMMGSERKNNEEDRSLNDSIIY